MHNHVWLYLMKKAAEEPDHYKMLTYYDDTIPALVIGFRYQKKIGLWQTRSTPALTKAVAEEMVYQHARDERISAKDVMFYGKIRTLRPPTLVE